MGMHEYIYEVKLLVAGECGLVIEFGEGVSPKVNKYVHQLTRRLNDGGLTGILEVVPTYRSVMVYFDPLMIARQALEAYVRECIVRMEPQKNEDLPSKLIRIPVCYGGVLGPDLEYVTRYTGLTAEKVIDLHTSKAYLVYMLGFTPGFPYLGSLSDELVIPRKDKPLQRVPAGSVGITGNQTGFYPGESQGEWWLIGRTPVKTVDLESSESFLVSPGDYVQFFSISMEEYFAIRQEEARGRYLPEIVAIC